MGRRPSGGIQAEPAEGSWRRWSVVGAYALAMGWLEAAVVVYLRTWLARIEPFQTDPLPMVHGIAVVELLRELATIVMIAAVGWLAGRTRRTRLGYALAIFGIWDLSYYLFLKGILGWPPSLLAWDILFLLPLPWWGPVLAPTAIAGLMTVTGVLLSIPGQGAPRSWPRRGSLIAAAIGLVLALAIFMRDAAQALPKGELAIRAALPSAFAWRPFALAFVLMAAPAGDLALRWTRRYATPDPAQGPLS